MIWFTSDTHFGHFNIIEYCHRPFKTVQYMDKMLIDNWNEKVKPGDTVYHLGDFCFKKSSEAPDGNVWDFYRKQLNGDIIFIKGNHDKSNGAKTILQGALIETFGQQVYLVHKPEHTNFHYNIAFCGHVHDKWKFKWEEKIIYDNHLFTQLIVNVGVDQWNFAPIHAHQIFKAINRFKQGRDNV